MPRRGAEPPSYRLHEPGGQAHVILAGEYVYLEKHGTPGS